MIGIIFALLAALSQAVLWVSLKKSGIGREYGRAGMQEFAQIKLIAINKA